MRTIVGAVLCLLVLAGAAAAQPSDADVKKAKAHFKQGKAYQDAGALDQAIDEYQQAYALAKIPDLLFNIAQVYRMKSDRPRALEYYKKYLDAVPEGKAADEARVHVARMTKEQNDADAVAAKAAAEKAAADKAAADKAAAEKAAADKAAADKAAANQTAAERAAAERAAAERAAAERAAAEKAAAERAAAEKAAAEKAAADKAAVGAPQPEPKRGARGKGQRIAGLATAGAGLVVVGLGAYFGSVAADRSDFVTEGADMWTPDLVQAINDGKAAESSMFVCYGVGAAAVAIGAVVYLLAPSGAEASVVPAAGPGTAGLVFSGVF
jgi:tetratricopeptide (TPR) repeat protein